MAPWCPLSVLYLLLFTILLSAAEQSPLLLPLTHILSRTHNTTTHPNHHLRLLKSASLRSAARARNRRDNGRRWQQRQVSLPLSPGSDYTLSFSVGSRDSHTVELYMDTGSDLVWFPCAPFECIGCDSTPPPGSIRFRGGAPVPCYSPSCSAVHSFDPSSDLCAVAGCPLENIANSTCSAFPCPPFYYAYGDGNLTARLRRDHLAIPAGVANALQLPNFTFGCAHTALAEPVGVAGFAWGVLSLPAQLARHSPHLGKHFSYCLVPHRSEAQKFHRPSPLILGRTDSSLGTEKPFVYTPMLHNPNGPWYTVGLDAVSVGGRMILAPPELRKVDRRGNGGVAVDSGTTLTMLPAGLYAQITEEFDRRMTGSGHERAFDAEADTGLGPCYHEPGAGNNSLTGVPAVVLHFAGNTTVALPRRNYYHRFSSSGKRMGCLMLMSDREEEEGGEADSVGPVGILGNVQQEGFEVVYDLDGRRVGFARRRCAALWDSLSRG